MQRRQFRGQGPRTAVGFTLVEVLVAMVLVAIVTAISLPSFRDFAVGVALRAQVSDFSGAIRLARTEAIKRGRVVTLCRTNDATVAQPACASGDDWSQGWVLRQGDTVIQVQGAYRNSGGIASGGVASIRFLPTGLAQGATGQFSFKPNVPASDAALARLTRNLCISANGVTRNC